MSKFYVIGKASPELLKKGGKNERHIGSRKT